MKIGNRVKTPYGYGTIIGIEEAYKTKRYIIRLDQPSKLAFNPAAFWKGEISLATNKINFNDNT